MNDICEDWKLYMPNETYKDDSSSVHKIETMKKHIEENQRFYDLAAVKDALWFPIQIQNLQNDENFIKNYTNFHQELCEKPEYFLNCFGLAMHQIISNLSEINASELQINRYKKFHPRIIGLHPLTKMSSLKTNKIGKLVSTTGTIMRVNSPELFPTSINWQCNVCASEQVVHQTDGIITQPKSCIERCREKSNFIPLINSELTVTEFIQIIKLQESFLGRESGRIPLYIDIELTKDLIDCVCPGDEIIVTGILKMKSQEEDSNKKIITHIYKTYIEAVSLCTAAAATSNKSISKKNTEFNQRDLKLINAIKNQPNPFRLLVNSLCPSIFGHEMVKAGLLLGLFGGGGGGIEAQNHRSEIHVLIIGDPGMGKSQMLTACSNVSPRGVFVCGDSSTQAGLTIAIRQDKQNSGSIEAGALVLANQGTCCIDEFDKMSKNHKVLLDVMEAQTISIAKAGVLCSFPAKTTILAAANPSGGHYNKGKTLSENLKMGQPLLSRFDLVFILIDNADEKLDELISKHNNNIRTRTDDLTTLRLDKSLKLLLGEQIDYLPHLLMKKYISYTKTKINPNLTEKAMDLIQKFYLHIRSSKCNTDAVPVTTRQLEALVRMTQSRAKIDFCEEANDHHVRDVIDIVKYSMQGMGKGELGLIQPNNILKRASVSLATEVKNFLSLLREQAATLVQIYTLDQLRQLGHPHGFSENLSQIIDYLNCKGYLIKTGSNTYKFIDS